MSALPQRVPAGTKGNSPRFQPWVASQKTVKSQGDGRMSLSVCPLRFTHATLNLLLLQFQALNHQLSTINFSTPPPAPAPSRASPPPHPNAMEPGCPHPWLHLIRPARERHQPKPPPPPH